MYYMNQGKKSKETIDEMMQRKKAKEREKRIKQNKQQKQTSRPPSYYWLDFHEEVYVTSPILTNI